MIRSVLLLTAIVLIPALTFGQAQTTGRIAGRVVDGEGSPIAGARVTLISSSLQGERTAESDGNGKFLAALLPVGPYSVSVAAPEKQSVQVSLRLGVGQTVPLEVTLKPGKEIVERVTVHATASPLETTVVGENFNYHTAIEELPVADRNILNVTSYAPNVREGPWAAEVLFGQSSALVVSGAAAYDTIVQLEGVDISGPYYGQALLLYLEDAVEEVQVLTSGISSRYGRFQGGVVNTITKSGGNEFEGTLRAELSKESWNSTTPFGEEQGDDLNEVYQGTLGGYFAKDKLWFFAGARSVPTKKVTATTVTTGESYTGGIDDTRWQLKLRGAPSPDHVIEASYLERDFETTSDSGFLSGDLLAATTFYNVEPMSLFTVVYQGVLGPTSFLDVRASSKQHSTTCCSIDVPRSRFVDLGTGRNGVQYNSFFGRPSDEWQRDGESASVAFTRLFAGAARGSHTLEGGAQFVRSTARGKQFASPTGLVWGGLSGPTTPFAVLNSQTGQPLYNLGGEVFSLRLANIPGPEPEGVVDNIALYAQDSWQLARWRFDLGLRWERYDVSTYRADLERTLDAFAPRIGVTHNISPRWQVQATWGRYVGKFYDRLLQEAAGIMVGSYDIRSYTGPAQTNLTADEVESVIRDDSLWGGLISINDLDQPTQFLAEGIELPYADELTLGVRAGLPGRSGSLTATFVDRDYKNLQDSFVGGFGDQVILDPATGEPPLDPFGEPVRIDTQIWDNAASAKRRYRALAVTWDYRPRARWDVGGNWTYSELTGNQDYRSSFGEEFLSIGGTAIGTYERSRPEAAAVPDGYLLDDVRHRIRAWGNYRFDLKRAGALALGGVGRYQTGGNWSRSAFVPHADDPEYNNETGLPYIHYFDGRGNNDFDDWWAIDLSARWQFLIFKRMNGWLKATVINVFDNDTLIAYDTSGFAVDDGMGNLSWAPQGNCGPGDPASVDCSGFGRIRNQSDYQTPRSYLFTLGVSF